MFSCSQCADLWGSQRSTPHELFMFWTSPWGNFSLVLLHWCVLETVHKQHWKIWWTMAILSNPQIFWVNDWNQKTSVLEQWTNDHAMCFCCGKIVKWQFLCQMIKVNHNGGSVKIMLPPELPAWLQFFGEGGNGGEWVIIAFHLEMFIQWRSEGSNCGFLTAFHVKWRVSIDFLLACLGQTDRTACVLRTLFGRNVFAVIWAILRTWFRSISMALDWRNSFLFNCSLMVSSKVFGMDLTAWSKCCSSLTTDH